MALEHQRHALFLFFTLLLTMNRVERMMIAEVKRSLPAMENVIETTSAAAQDAGAWPIEVGGIYLWKEESKYGTAYRVIQALGKDRFEVIHHWTKTGHEHGPSNVCGEVIRALCFPPDQSEMPALRARIKRLEETLTEIVVFAVGEGDVCEIIVKMARLALMGDGPENE
jgi:ethanolamine utilization microcompartment shell protein EutL